jgi:hypothetical protein
MTIKQYGGVFGRNPTFNDVTIEGQLTFDGDIDINSDLKIDGDLEVSGDVDITSTAANPLALVSTNASGAYATFNNGVQTSLFAGFGSTLMTGATTSDAVLRYDSNDNLYIARGSAKVATFNNTGSLEISNGNVIMGTSGSGIDFSATAGTGTSELFDDYEEGLYTATLTPSTSGTITVSSSNDQLAYTKIGRVVYVQGFISSSGVSSPVGGVVYLNLPFAPATLSEGAGFSTGAFIFADAPSYALTNYGCVVSPSGSRNELLIDASLVGNGDEFQIGFNYITL